MKHRKSNPVKTVLIITVGLTAIGLIADVRWMMVMALGIGLLGGISDYLAEKIDWLWMKLAWLLSLVVPNILLSIIFFLFLWPIAALSRLARHSDLLSLKNTSNTLFRKREKSYSPSDFEKLW
jgi:hypothetical protein